MSGPALALMADPAALHTQRWARAFRDCGYAVQILSAGTQTAVDSIPVIPILDATRDPGTGALARSWANLQEYGRVRRLLKRFDLVHVHYLSCGRHLALLKGLPRLLITPWGSDILPRLSPLSPHQLHWGRVALHAAQSVCALSHYMGGELQRIYGVAPSRIQVIPWGADTTLFDPARVIVPPDEPFTIGFFKHLLPIYGPQVLLLALEIFRHQAPGPWRCLIYGAGPLETELAIQIADTQLSDHVQLMGRIAHHALPAAMAQCHVVVSPSIIAESLGVASLEAQALGIPVINSNAGGMPETLIANESGFLAPPGEPAALESLILRFARDPELRQRMGDRGRAFIAEQQLDWATTVQRVDALQRSLLK